MNIFQLEISTQCDIKVENSSTWCKFHEGRKGPLPMGSKADPSQNRWSMELDEMRMISTQIRWQDPCWCKL